MSRYIVFGIEDGYHPHGADDDILDIFDILEDAIKCAYNNTTNCDWTRVYDVITRTVVWDSYEEEQKEKDKNPKHISYSEYLSKKMQQK
jgi:hypothetical protein